ncbi:MAG: CaiB/BaiF CoA-transferase family protein [Gammaproteobacteria bacterium]|nr:CaiB/BaiF CoA-transferase family protein [Gammaproteobacteria bacterium]
MTTEGALAGLKVLDVAGTIASGYCGKLFADHGAEVINVEPPDGGFETRREPPLVPGAAVPESSALHAYLSTNKASVALDIDAEPEQLLRLAQGSAVVLDDGRFDCTAFTEVAPEVVVSTITWFGRHGPYAGFEGNGAVVWALAGMVRNVGPEQGPPWVPTGCGAEIVGGLAAYIGTLGQVVSRAMGNATGPVRLDTSIHEANLCFTEVGGVGGYRSGRRGKRLGVNRFAPTYPLGVYACADGWLGVTALTPRQWRNFCSLLAMDQYADEPDYQTAIGRLLDYDTLEPIIRARVRKRSAAELVARGQSLRIPLAPVPTMAELFSVDQYVHRGAFTRIACNGTGFSVPATPFRLFRTPSAAGGTVARLGESNTEYLP